MKGSAPIITAAAAGFGSAITLMLAAGANSRVVGVVSAPPPPPPPEPCTMTMLEWKGFSPTSNPSARRTAGPRCITWPRTKCINVWSKQPSRMAAPCQRRKRIFTNDSGWRQLARCASKGLTSTRGAR
jgi:hypothetical protein